MTALFSCHERSKTAAATIEHRTALSEHKTSFIASAPMRQRRQARLLRPFTASEFRKTPACADKRVRSPCPSLQAGSFRMILHLFKMNLTSFQQRVGQTMSDRSKRPTSWIGTLQQKVSMWGRAAPTTFLVDLSKEQKSHCP